MNFINLQLSSLKTRYSVHNLMLQSGTVLLSLGVHVRGSMAEVVRAVLCLNNARIKHDKD